MDLVTEMAKVEFNIVSKVLIGMEFDHTTGVVPHINYKTGEVNNGSFWEALTDNLSDQVYTSIHPLSIICHSARK